MVTDEVAGLPQKIYSPAIARGWWAGLWTNAGFSPETSYLLSVLLHKAVHYMEAGFKSCSLSVNFEVIN